MWNKTTVQKLLICLFLFRVKSVQGYKLKSKSYLRWCFVPSYISDCRDEYNPVMKSKIFTEFVKKLLFSLVIRDWPLAIMNQHHGPFFFMQKKKKLVEHESTYMHNNFGHSMIRSLPKMSGINPHTNRYHRLPLRAVFSPTCSNKTDC